MKTNTKVYLTLKYCIDSDILIDYLRGIEKARIFLLEKSKSIPLAISVVSVVEIYAGKETKDASKRKKINLFLNNFETIQLTPDVAKYAGELRRDYQLPFADMIIAASALSKNLTLVTRNTKHFNKIKNLKTFCPY